MQAEPTLRTLIALMLALLLIATALPAGASVPVMTDDGPVMVDSSQDDHEERCCQPEFGGHGFCHAVAALLELDVTRTEAPASNLIRSLRTPLVTRSLPPIQKPPIVLS